ncbi:hypothetical protein IE53DRAFT_242914 [Violaceomyces palustris]|uniref:Uncharacterized protein n=1 Tax=Violaceomyces palustris TaxID=1673888 RepID=A0ACD0P488_9BASI|nr:hypothetical protein IE53DRAFT_242914 [Violaceomyces palustris]
MKVRLRVPLSSALREDSSGNSFDNTDNDLQDQSSQASASPGPEEDDPDAAEEAEMDELIDETPMAQNQSVGSPQTSKTAKTKSSRSRNGSSKPAPKAKVAKAAAERSSSQRLDVSNSPSPSLGSIIDAESEGVTTGTSTPLAGGKRAKSIAAQVAQSLTLEELDALPAAKRRKSHKARGAPGPGRGWRKGLVKGQKPIYELPPLPAQAMSTPSGAAQPSSISKSQASTLKQDIASAPMAVDPSQTNAGQAKTSSNTSRPTGWKYPPLPSTKSGPPINPLAKIPVSFQPSSPLDRTGSTKRVRSWEKKPREILNLGGRSWRISTWYGGEDRGFNPKAVAEAAAAAAAAASSSGNVVTGQSATSLNTGGADTSTPSTPSGNHKPQQSTLTSIKASGGSKPASASTPKDASPLPLPKHATVTKSHVAGDITPGDAADWRGQSPAFLAGAR